MTPLQASNQAVKQREMCIPSYPPNHSANGAFYRARERRVSGPSDESEGMRCTTCNPHLPLSEFCDGSNPPFSVCSHFALAVFSLCSRCALAVLSLCSRCALAVLSLCSRFAFTALSSLHCHFCVTLLWPVSHCADSTLTALSFLSHCALTTQVKISPNHFFFP